jgi:2-polyprenyl-6-hydroxyphenyl methylase/3-demethylubiquinone-9 3-methyltransferase
MATSPNVHGEEIEKFGNKAHDWWNPQGELKTLHAVNPLRLQFIRTHTDLRGKNVVDVGCGGGILSEALAFAGARVLGIDLSTPLLEAAVQHAEESKIDLEYRQISVESLAEECPNGFDAVTCMEMLEHVPEPSSVVMSCARLVKPGGKVFFSTLNRNLKSYLLAIIGAEYLLRMIPPGTHQFATFIKPSELCQWARKSHLELLGFQGISYDPLSGRFSLSSDLDVNFLAAFERPRG